MTSGNVGSEETENPKILWPKSLAHRNMYESKGVTLIKTTVNVGTMMLSMVVWLAIYLYSFEWMVDYLDREVQRGPGLEVDIKAGKEGGALPAEGPHIGVT
jgi:hypothetical protein